MDDEDIVLGSVGGGGSNGYLYPGDTGQVILSGFKETGSIFNTKYEDIAMIKVSLTGSVTEDAPITESLKGISYLYTFDGYDGWLEIAIQNDTASEIVIDRCRYITYMDGIPTDIGYISPSSADSMVSANSPITLKDERFKQPQSNQVDVYLNFRVNQ